VLDRLLTIPAPGGAQSHEPASGPWSGPELDYPCDYCGAHEGQKCVNQPSGNTSPRPHKVRQKDAIL
jgi:hypothetical protein